MSDPPYDPLEGPDVGFDPEDLEQLIDWTMPFGRYRDRALIDLPEEYLLWFEKRGFPGGDLGRLMSLSLGIKRHGAEPVVRQLRQRLDRMNRSGATRSPSRTKDG